MASDSMYGKNHSLHVNSLLNGVRKNMAFLNHEDLKVLEFLGKKGDFEKQQATLIKVKE